MAIFNLYLTNVKYYGHDCTVMVILLTIKRKLHIGCRISIVIMKFSMCFLRSLKHICMIMQLCVWVNK